MMLSSWVLRGFTAAIVVALGLQLYGTVLSVRAVDAEDARCAAAGGVLFRTAGGRLVCVKPPALEVLK